MKVLVVDVGGTHVKILANGQDRPREFPSGPRLTARRMVVRVKKLAAGWKYDRVSKKWRRHVTDVVERLVGALQPDDVVLGGGNVKKVKTLPSGCRAGDNANAFTGGFRLWENTRGPRAFPRVRR